MKRQEERLAASVETNKQTSLRQTCAELSDQPASAASGFALPHTTGSAIRALGTPEFPVVFGRMVASDYQSDQIIVFKMDDRGRMRTLLAENLLRGAGHAHALADSYTAWHWLKDPNLRLLMPSSKAVGGEVVLLARSVKELADGEYRQRLFTEPRLGAKASIIGRAANQVFYVNLYRGIDRIPYTAGELEGLRRGCDVLLALLERHFAPLNDEVAGDLDTMQRAIEGTSVEHGRNRLSAREASVCARIVAGHSTEEVRLALGVSLHSVISYRRRAFEKLGISTQKELFALLLRQRARV